MPNKKLTDKEIVKALECCKTNRVADCKKCAFHLKERKPNINCVNELIASSIDLINRLQEENENYSKNNQQMTSDILALYKALKTAKTSAYKEFAERLKAVSHPYADTQMVFEVQIDNLLKELVGEDK